MQCFCVLKKNHAQTLEHPTQTHDATYACMQHGMLEGCCQQSEVWGNPGYGEQRPLP